MAPKSAAPAPKSAAPASESSASSYTSSGSGEEEDVRVSQPQKKPAAAAAPPKPSFNAPIEEDSSTGDYNSSDDSASDSDAAAEPSPPTKPLPPPPAPAASDKKKRKEAPPPPLENNNENGGGGGVDGKKRQRFQRLWSEDDEIAILHGMLNHQAKTGALPSKTDMAAFRDSIHKNLTTDISIRQLTEKVRRFRSKYDKNPSTASSGKPHDSAVHELCHKIWGASNGAGSAGKHGKGKEVEGNDNSVKVKPRYTFLKHAVTRMGDCLPCSVTLEEVLNFVDDSKAMAIEERLKKLWRLQLKNQAREMEIKKETNMMLMEALEKMG